MQHVHGHSGNLEMNVLIMPPHLGHSDLCPIITLLHVGFVMTLIPLLVFGSCNNIGEVLENCVTLELKQRRYLTTGVSAVFHIGLSVTVTHALHHVWFALSSLFRAQPSAVTSCILSEPWKAHLRVFLPLRVLEKVAHTTCGILLMSCFSRADQRRF